MPRNAGGSDSSTVTSTKTGNSSPSRAAPNNNPVENVDSNRFLVPFLRKQTAMHPSKLRAPMGKVTDSMITATEQAERWKRRRLKRQKQFAAWSQGQMESREQHSTSGRREIQEDVHIKLREIIDVQVVKLQRMIRRKLVIPKRNEKRRLEKLAAPPAPTTPTNAEVMVIDAGPGTELSPMSVGSPLAGVPETDSYPHLMDGYLKECTAGATAIQSRFRGIKARNTGDIITDGVFEDEDGRPKTSTGRPKTSGRVASSAEVDVGSHVEILDLGVYEDSDAIAGGGVGAAEVFSLEEVETTAEEDAEYAAAEAATAAAAAAAARAEAEAEAEAVLALARALALKILQQLLAQVRAVSQGRAVWSKNEVGVAAETIN